MVVDQAVTVFDFDGTLFHLPVDYAAVRGELDLDAEAKIGPLLQRFLDEGNAAGLAVVTRHELSAVTEGSFTPGAQDILRAGGDIAILTRNSRLAVVEALDGLADGLLIVGREDVRRLKPDPEGLTRILAEFNVKPAQAVLVGDTYHDVQAARAAEVGSVIVRNPLLRYAPEGADHYIDDLTAISR